MRNIGSPILWRKPILQRPSTFIDFVTRETHRLHNGPTCRLRSFMLSRYEFHNLMVCNSLLSVGESQEPFVDPVKLMPIGTESQPLAAQAQGVTAGMFTENQVCSWRSHRLRRHDFVCLSILKNSVLMNSGLVSKSVASNDRFVRLNLHGSNLAQQLAR